MSEDWFDRAYRSEGTPPEELNARVLASARRVTRRWLVPLIAAAIATLIAALLIALALVSHEFYVPPNPQPNQPAQAPEPRSPPNPGLPVRRGIG